MVTDLDGAVVERAEVEIPPSLGDDAVAAAERLLTELVELADQPIIGVGVGTPGIVDDQGVVLSAPNLGWRDVPLRGPPGRSLRPPRRRLERRRRCGRRRSSPSVRASPT
ncbi:MAG: ROK family protein [Acidimicrobiales bacterium]